MLQSEVLRMQISVYETTLSKVHNIDASFNPKKMAFLRALYIAESIPDFIKLNSTGRPSWLLATTSKASPTAENYEKNTSGGFSHFQQSTN